MRDKCESGYSQDVRFHPMNSTVPQSSRVQGLEKKSNFRDPFGLIWRMLRSGDRAAYAVLLRRGLAYGVLPLDWALQSRERRLLQSVDTEATGQPLVLIVGPPRSGSTLLYQTLSRYANVSYFTNWTVQFSRSPISATRMVQGRQLRSKRDFRNYYGQTAGLKSPNDGFEIWNRWFGSDRYRTRELLDSEAVADMRRFFAAWTQQFNRPFLNKNNRNTDCVNLLSEVLPQAHFLVIRRDPLFIAQSLLEARQQIQGSKDKAWGLASTQQHAEADEPLGYIDDVCDQLIAIENRLREHSKALDPKRLVEVTYEEFCRDPSKTLFRICDNVPGLCIEESLVAQELTPFTVSSTMRLSAEEQQRIQRRFAQVPGGAVFT